jgi:hypothetical protein
MSAADRAFSTRTVPLRCEGCGKGRYLRSWRGGYACEVCYQRVERADFAAKLEPCEALVEVDGDTLAVQITMGPTP